jgi:polysaccharide deacetylase family protein (PEP-CTERM system associated)
MINALTIDVEDYYMVSAFADTIKFSDWSLYESRVERNTRRILELMDNHNVTGTFFVLGWVAEKCPALVREIQARGHEIASHGYNHRLIYDLSPQEFRNDTRMSKDILENITGQAVHGYRATSYSIVQQSLWALDILIQEGFKYDSSIFPIHHDRYGMPQAERFPYVIQRAPGEIVEFPPATYRLMGRNIPVAGGGYLRLFPLSFTKMAIRDINKREKQSAVIYFHPWEIDPLQPRLSGSPLSRFRHYVNLNSTFDKLDTLLSDFKFSPLINLMPSPGLCKKVLHRE